VNNAPCDRAIAGRPAPIYDPAAAARPLRTAARGQPVAAHRARVCLAFRAAVSVILSAQATDKSVNLATAELFRKANSPEAVMRLGRRELERYIKRIGLYRTKAKNILATCKRLLEHHGGEVPRTRAELEGAPGVGRKTANVILNTAFGEPTIAVDTHIFRVANRTGIAPGKNVGAVEDKLLKAVPDEFKLDAHHWLILHGRYVCKARKPDCPLCLINDLCRFRHKTA